MTCSDHSLSGRPSFRRERPCWGGGGGEARHRGPVSTSVSRSWGLAGRRLRSNAYVSVEQVVDLTGVCRRVKVFGSWRCMGRFGRVTNLSYPLPRLTRRRCSSSESVGGGAVGCGGLPPFPVPSSHVRRRSSLSSSESVGGGALGGRCPEGGGGGGPVYMVPAPAVDP